MEHLVENTIFLASISAILLVSGLIIVKTNFPLSSKTAESDQKITFWFQGNELKHSTCLLYTSPSPRDRSLSRMPSSA